jgi:hypothetical protein
MSEKSLNIGDETKINYEVLFEDFPESNPYYVQLLREGRYRDLLSLCVASCGWEEIHRARMYGMSKYPRMNWEKSKGTEDHDNFFNANKRSAYRHLAASEVEEIDEESGCKHLAMVGLRCMIALEYMA